MRYFAKLTFVSGTHPRGQLKSLIAIRAERVHTSARTPNAVGLSTHEIDKNKPAVYTVNKFSFQ